MYNPQCTGGPAQINDPFFSCRLLDQGSVHVNSGPVSQAFALLVDGAVAGDFIEQAIPPIGFIKALNIYVRAFYTKTTPTTTFQQHANDLIQSCNELIGQDVKNPLDGKRIRTPNQHTT